MLYALHSSRLYIYFWENGLFFLHSISESRISAISAAAQGLMIRFCASRMRRASVGSATTECASSAASSAVLAERDMPEVEKKVLL